MSEFKELILKLRNDSESIKKIFEYVKSDPVEISQMPDDSYVVNDGNHRANLLNLLRVDVIPSIINGEFTLIDVEKLRRPNGSIGTQGFTSENMTKLINHILNVKKTNHSLFEELIEYTKNDENIVKSFQTKDSLSKDIFIEKEGEYKMIDDVRKKLLDVVDNFVESLGVEFFIHDITLTGSLSNYNWSEYSDVDLHILVDMEEIGGKDKKTETIQTIIKQFFDSKKNIWNEKHSIKIKNYDVEVYIQDVNEAHLSSGVYSVLNNKWIIEPIKENPKIDDKKILEKGDEFMDKVDNLYKLENKDEVIIKIDNLRKKLKNFRQSGLEDGGEYSYENLTFKLLRRNGYINKLIELKNKVIGNKLSITQ